MKLVTAEEMRRLEGAAIDAGATERQLMEEAGLAVAQEAWMLLGSLEGRRILVLAGPGNNGGDGLVAGRHLAEWGAEIAAYLPLPRDPDEHLAALEERGATIVAAADDLDGEMLDALLSSADMVIDALLGIGKTRPIEPASPLGAALVHLAQARASHMPPKLIAVDLPTGLDCDSGAVDPLLVAPDMTVTFGLPKVGMYQAPGSGVVGKVQVIDIGIPAEASASVSLELLTGRWLRGALPARPEDGNKGTFGRLLILGGSRRYVGAPQLAALGAYRAGAGLATIACPEPNVAMLAGSMSEATWLPLEAAEDGTLAESSSLALRSEWQAYDAAVIGPGLGLSGSTRALVWAILDDVGAEISRGVVIDADALNALAAMADAAQRVPPNAVLTPHPGEMARLLDTTVADVQARRLEFAKQAARKFGCTVILKGAHSVVAAPDGRVRLSPFANPLLATAGTGDVLAGMVGGYLAQGLEPFDAAAVGVYLHAAAGEALREQYGDAGLLASELAARLPSVVRELAAP
jgi:NAD(P)H-hydrate epimerase